MELELEDVSLRNDTNTVRAKGTAPVNELNGATESLIISSFPPVASLL